MSYLKRPDYDDIHGFVERVEDVLLSESSWSTSDSDCSGCLHLSKESVNTEDLCAGPTVVAADGVSEQTPLVTHVAVARDKKSASSSRISVAGLTWKKLSGGGRRKSTDSVSPDKPYKPRLSPEKPLHLGRMLRQRDLLAAGAQPWNKNICAASHRRFAYAATLVIYVYEEATGGWQLCSVLADHRKTITSLAWHPRLKDLIASSSEDQTVCVWSVRQQAVLHAISLCRCPILVAWRSLSTNREVVSFSTARGPVQLWQHQDGAQPEPYGDSHAYRGGVALFRWHPSCLGRLAVAHTDARISLFSDGDSANKSNWFPGNDLPSDCSESSAGTILGLEWALCSPDFLLLSYSGGQLWLVDAVGFTVVTEFSVPSSAVLASVAWLPQAPGIFVSGDRDKGILRVWTVGKKTPMCSYSLKNTGFHELCGACATSDDFQVSRSEIVVPAVSVLCLFQDGGIGLYHVRRKHWIFNREHGHTETIFDCCFKPENSDLLATGSFDGSIKVWRVDSMEAVSTVPNCRAIIYSVSWAPADLNCIVAGTSEGKVFIWDLTRGKVVQDFKGHKKNKIYCVAWNQKDSRRIVSVGESCVCLVHEVSGQQLQGYIHPEPLYGADWRDANILATACRDGCIRVFNVQRSGSEPLALLKGHSKKVFRVKWNPVIPDILCSGSDDCTVCVWSMSKAQCLSVLMGHTDNVRGLAWCPEVPHLLVSGSWDRSIRVWDARSATCLDTVTEHGADIYGLSIHPGRPFLLASCSRDSTVRLWSLAWFVAPLQLRLLAGHPLHEAIASPDHVAAQQLSDVQLKLSGARAEHLMALQTSSSTNNNENFQLHKLTRVIADVFAADAHVTNLWDLLSVVCLSAPVSSLSPRYRTSLVHHTHLASYSVAEAERQLQSSSVASAVRGEHQADLDALALKFLESGALRQYCEVTVKAGAWDRALAIAPAVSMSFWRSLLDRYCAKLVSEESGSCVPYLTAAHDSDRLLDYHLLRGDVKAAFRSCVAMSSQSSREPQRPADEERRPCLATPSDGKTAISSRLQECAGVLAEWYLNKGSPVQASCALLAADHFSGCLLYLLRGHELELLLSAARMLLSSKVCPSSLLAAYVDTALSYLAQRAISLNLPHVALDFALAHSKGMPGLVLQFSVVLGSDPLAKDALLARSDLPNFLQPPPSSSPQKDNPLVNSAPDDPLSIPADQQSLANTSDNHQETSNALTSSDAADQPVGVPATPTTSDSTILSSMIQNGQVSRDERAMALSDRDVELLRGVMAGLLSGGLVEATQPALQIIIEAMQKMDLSSPSVWLLVKVLQACPLSLTATEGGTDGGAATDTVRWSAAVLAVSAATGAVKATALEYFSIVPHLLALARMYVERYKAHHGQVIDSFVRTLQTRWEDREGKKMSTMEKTVLGVKISHVVDSWPDKGATQVCGSHLPRHNHTCCVTRASVKGPTYTVRDGDAVLGLNEALMLAKVHPFSPVGSCSRLQPF